MGYHQPHKAGFNATSIPEILKTVMLTKNSPLWFKKKLKRKRLCQGQSNLNYRVSGQNGVALLVQIFLEKSILGMTNSLLSFCLRATYDTLPSTSNLHRWNITTLTSCKLCHKQICTTSQTLVHVNLLCNRVGLPFDIIVLSLPL